MDVKTIRGRVTRCDPCATREGVHYYWLKDVAPYLVPLPPDVIERVCRMNHMDLPAMLKKEFWTGQAQMLKVKELEGDLWRTQTVVDYVGTAFKDIRMSIMLMSDTVERETQLTDRQRDTVKNLLDGLLLEIQSKLAESFKAKRNDPNGKPAGGNSGPSIDDIVSDL